MTPFEQMNARAQVMTPVAAYMRQVYLWMTAGLCITGAVAWGVANTPALSQLILGNSIMLIGLVIIEFGLVIALSAAISKMSSGTATALFLLYSALTGATLSSIFIVYDLGSIATAFMVTAGTFLAMSVYGYMTKRDLTGFGHFLFMGLVGIIIAMIVNIFLHNSMMNFVISCIGVLIFTGLTAVDTQKLMRFGQNAPLDDAVALRRGSILGALTLYLDFLNIFLMLLQIFGGSRD